jgi:hypothetical protein
MNKSVHSYEDLLSEKKRLELLLQTQKMIIHQDVQELKAQLQPVRDVLHFVKKLTTRDKSSLLLTIGSDIVINSVVRRFILSRAGWFMRTIIPYFLKNYSSHVLAEQTEKWVDKLRSWLGHKNGKEHQKEKEPSKDDSAKGDG